MCSIRGTRMKTEEQVYGEILAYINSNKHNKPCTLQSIKKEQRTKRIVDLVFSHPSVFNFEVEFNHVPEELKTEELLMKYVLGHPYFMKNLTEEKSTLPVMVAFEICKRRYERISAMWWGSSRERIPYYGKTQECRKQIQEIADNVLSGLEENAKSEDIIKKIQQLCGEKTIQSQSETYQSKCNNFSFDSDKRIVILISGHPDSGKTTFGNLLNLKINDSVAFDSDMMLLSNRLGESFNTLAGKAKVVIFSDLDADRFFSKEELAGCEVFNIHMNPESIKEMYRNSKYMRQLSFEEYMSRFYQETKDKTRFKDAIQVTNTYDMMLIKEADRVIDVISRELSSENEEIIENN